MAMQNARCQYLLIFLRLLQYLWPVILGVDEELADVVPRFVCATRAQTLHPVLLRSYTTYAPSEENHDCFIWEAARATSAVPLFFEPTTLMSGATLVDGGLRHNNPIKEVLNEAEYLYPNAGYKTVLSIGTGLIDAHGLAVSQPKYHAVIKTCIDLSHNANNEAQKFVREKQGSELRENGTYFRLTLIEVSTTSPWTAGRNWTTSMRLRKHIYLVMGRN